MKNNCKKQDRLGKCCVCDGRIHNLLCTSTLNPKIDCCPERHIRLYLSGNLKGLGDDSVSMMTPEHIKMINVWTKKEKLSFWQI